MFYCIADEDTVRGFRLAGVPGQAVASAAAAAAALQVAADSRGADVILLTEGLAAEIGPLVETIRFEREHPLILEIPGPEGPSPGRRTLRELVEEAVGLRID